MLALTCGDASWPGPDGVRVAPVPARPGREDLAPLLDRTDRVVVVGTDADLAAVVLRLLRAEQLGAVAVGYVPVSALSEVARLWSLPVAGPAAAALAVGGHPDRVPLVRDDAGGVLVGLGVVRPVRGVAYCDDDLVLRGQAARLEVSPDLERGLVVRVVRRSLVGRRVRAAAGRAMQLGCLPTGVQRDGVPVRTTDRWTWYRHTEDLRLVRGLL